MSEIKWGVIGCGGISNKFAASLNALEAGTLSAAASRTPGLADKFAAEHRAARCYADYESLVTDPEIDAVYVATPHNFHYENTKLCLENGKHVLCEKPFTVNAAQAEELVALARRNNLFLMEALWTRFLPSIQKLQSLLAEGVIGEVRTVQADFCFPALPDPEHRLRNPALAGGALLDLGVYPINFAALVFGAHPVRIQSSAVMDETGVDAASYYFFDYENGERAVLSSSYINRSPNRGVVSGTEGYICLPHFHGAAKLHIHRSGHELETLEFSCPDDQTFKFEIEHAMECISDGRLESPVMPLAETVAVMRTMDALRNQWGLKYADE